MYLYSMQVTIRSATIDDVLKITSLSRQLGYNITEADTSNFLSALLPSGTEAVYVAEHADNVIGWMQLTHVTRIESGHFMEIAGLVVEEAYRSKGIGNMFIAFAKDQCKQKGIDKLRVRTNTVRLRTHSFYEKSGFTCVKEQKVYEIICSG